MNKELKDLGVGDRVIQVSGLGGRDYYIRRIERVTPTQIAANNGSRYRRDTGYSIGDGRSYYSNCLMVPTPTLLAKAENQWLTRKLDAVKWGDMALDTKRAAWKAINGDQSQNEEEA